MAGVAVGRIDCARGWADCHRHLPVGSPASHRAHCQAADGHRDSTTDAGGQADGDPCPDCTPDFGCGADTIAWRRIGTAHSGTSHDGDEGS